MLTWQWRSFDELTPHELYNILALRQDVFNLEQQCTEPDIDHQDQRAMHLLGLQDNKLVAYLRVFKPGILYPNAASIGRVVTAKSVRGQSLGKKAMQEAMLYLANMSINISAQIYLQKFYESFGFSTQGEPYDEAGIRHIKMCKSHAKN